MRKRWLLILSFFLILVGLVTVLVLVQQRQEIRKKAVNYSAALTLAGETNPVVGDNFDINLILNPGGQDVVAVDVVLKFDLNLLQIVENGLDISSGLSANLQTFAPVVADGSFDKQTVIDQANQTGLLSFGALGFDWTADSPTDPVSTVATLAAITFNAVAEGTSAISFCFKNTTGEDCQTTIIQGSTPDTNVVNQAGEDILGAADSIIIEASPVGGPTNMPTPTATSTPTATPVPTNTPTPSPTPTATPAPTNTPTPTITPTPLPTPTSEPSTGNLTIKVKFQGINEDKGIKTAKITLRPDSGDEQVFDNFEFSQEDSGVYVATIHNLEPGTYTVLVKGWAHLQKNLGQIELTVGQTAIKDGSEAVLRAGDIAGGGPQQDLPDNIVDVSDIGAIIKVFNALGPVQDNIPANLNCDSVIDVEDIGLLITNFDPLSSGDE